MDAEEMFEIFMLAIRNARADVIQEKFKLGQEVKFHVPVVVDKTMVETKT